MKQETYQRLARVYVYIRKFNKEASEFYYEARQLLNDKSINWT